MNVKKNNIYIISNNLVCNENYLIYLLKDTYDEKQIMKYLKTHINEYPILKEKDFKFKKFSELINFGCPEINQLLLKHKYDNSKKFNIFKKWNRIFVDECHEVLKDEIKYHIFCDNQKLIKRSIKCNINSKELNKTNMFYSLKSNFKWLISATPFEKNIMNLNSYLIFLNNNKVFKNVFLEGDFKNEYENRVFNLKNKYILHALNEKQIETIFSNYITKTVKADIKDEVEIPIFTEDITYLSQNSVERNIYLEALRSNDVKNLLRLCTHIMVSNTTLDNKDLDDGKILSIEDIKNVMINKYKVNFNKLNNENLKNNELLLDNTNLIEKMKKLKLLFNKYKFTDSSSQYYLEDSKIEEINIFCEKRNRWYRGYASSKYFEFNDMFSEFVNVYLNNECFDVYLNNFNVFEENVDNIINSGQLFDCFNIKVYTIFKFIEESLETTIKDNKLLESKINKNKLEIIRLENQIKIFENDNFVKEAISDPCSICFMEFEDKLCITSCRHILCDNCIKIMFNNKSNINCPFCRTTLGKRDINFTSIDVLNNKKEEENENKVEELQNENEERIKKYGTKLAYLVSYLHQIFEDSENRVIIFSQYDEMLKLIGKVLDDFNIKNIFIKGNIRSVTKKIDLFKTDSSYRVIMLSSERSSSGSNLTEATHIIFADVINGNAETTKDIESQAIGRAVRIGQKKPVTVKRILMKNTIEEDIYLKNKYDMMDLQM